MIFLIEYPSSAINLLWVCQLSISKWLSFRTVSFNCITNVDWVISDDLTNFCFSRFIIFLSSTTSINGLEIKRRCGVPDIPQNLEPALRLENSDHHARIQDRGLASHDVPNTSCKQRYIVPVLWHIIIKSDKDGDVSDAVLQRQIDILNGNVRYRLI